MIKLEKCESNFLFFKSKFPFNLTAFLEKNPISSDSDLPLTVIKAAYEALRPYELIFMKILIYCCRYVEGLRIFLNDFKLCSNLESVEIGYPYHSEGLVDYFLVQWEMTNEALAKTILEKLGTL